MNTNYSSRKFLILILLVVLASVFNWFEKDLLAWGGIVGPLYFAYCGANIWQKYKVDQNFYTDEPKPIPDDDSGVVPDSMFRKDS